MIPTPDLSHLKASDYEHVYEPAEDTFIFLDALEKDVEELKQAKPRLCLEIGSGSGCVSAFVASILGPSCVYLCTDINSRATYATQATGHQNKVVLNPVITSLTSSLETRLKAAGGIDLLLFNPPYVPTAASEAEGAQGYRGIAGAWAGGQDGMDVTEKVLSSLKDLLSRSGRFYLVAVKANDVPAIRSRVRSEQGLESEIVLERRAGREYLYVVKFFRPQDDASEAP